MIIDDVFKHIGMLLPLILLYHTVIAFTASLSKSSTFKECSTRLKWKQSNFFLFFLFGRKEHKLSRNFFFNELSVNIFYFTQIIGLGIRRQDHVSFAIKHDWH